MARDNNGVKAKVTHDAGRGSLERGNGQAGNMGEEGGLRPVGAEVSPHASVKDNGGVGGKVTHNKRLGTEKDNGGVGDMGAGDHRDFFKDEH